MPVEHIGRYEIIGELGKGAMGVVYKATDPTIGRTVALKTMRVDTHGIEAEELLNRFKNEARAAGVLSHPNIVTIYDAGEQEGMFYMALEFIEGQTLQEVLKQQHVLPVEKVIDIIRQVCAGLDFAHSKGIIHRDVKPANIMIEPDGVAKIMDFGIAKGIGGGLTSTGQVLGTPNYMSPEQVKGRALDGRSDLFSLGVVLYEVLTGERPFIGQNVTTIIYKIVNEQPPAPRDLDVTIHPGLSAAVMKALAKAPDQRYQKGAELAQDLQNYKSYGTDASATVRMPEAAVTAVLPVAAIPSAVPASAATAAKPALAPMDSTVKVAPPLAAVPSAVTTKKSGVPSGVLIAVAAVALAVAGYFGLLRARLEVKPAPVAVAQPSAVPPQSEATKPASSTQVQTSEAAPATAAGPAQAPATAGELQVTSSPEGAQVKVDGRSEPKWVTPFTAAKLKPGTHTVAFAKDGYKPETRKVEIETGKRATASAELKAVQAFLAVTSTPPGAQILVDGALTGQVTPAKLAVSPGQHKVAVRLKGFWPQAALANVGAGQTLDLTPVLRPLSGPQQAQEEGGPFRKLRRLFGGNPQDKGTLEIRTRPKGAEIWVGDTQTPAKTPLRIPVNAGKYRITLRLPGYKPITRTVEVEKGKTYGVDEVFEKQ